jgi:hypothetical protein
MQVNRKGRLDSAGFIPFDLVSIGTQRIVRRAVAPSKACRSWISSRCGSFTLSGIGSRASSRQSDWAAWDSQRQRRWHTFKSNGGGVLDVVTLTSSRPKIGNVSSSSSESGPQQRMASCGRRLSVRLADNLRADLRRRCLMPSTVRGNCQGRPSGLPQNSRPLSAAPTRR